MRISPTNEAIIVIALESANDQRRHGPQLMGEWQSQICSGDLFSFLLSFFAKSKLNMHNFFMQHTNDKSLA